MSKILRVEGDVNKVYFSSAIVSVECINNDPHGNVYTNIVFSNNESLKVSNAFEDVLYLLDNSSSEIDLGEYDYKFEFSVGH